MNIYRIHFRHKHETLMQEIQSSSLEKARHVAVDWACKKFGVGVARILKVVPITDIEESRAYYSQLKKQEKST